jgi:hypothetical protein
MQPRTRFSIWYYLTVLAVIVVVDSLLFSGPGVPQIAYSDFLARVQADRVARAVITQDQIYGVMKVPGATGASTQPAPPFRTPRAPRSPSLRSLGWPMAQGERRDSKGSPFVLSLSKHRAEFLRDLLMRGLGALGGRGGHIPVFLVVKNQYAAVPMSAGATPAQSPAKRSTKRDQIPVGESSKIALLSAGPMSQSPRATSASS